ncbi:hypothetical protein FEDK69T_10010 [Flavobacterium enshiense DK69]|uniref:TonB C-terminal domain-containing protein n=1 Tax=Flavobacterium enshiense DK69 TaxID=1107311 RepID=V6SD76_9FLAO|nr:hypothetical protein [Flavobacterium enshiense]ESU24551.1 hypothetical protein FEDK69T_10010 [Flavobacterium enshiense DK69]KGO93801.1 hypothetical protein Q767_14050 [Flavobacterium enshiense DK69]
MSKKLFALTIFSLTVISCQLFDKKAPSEDELLQKELEKIDWKKVDAFPSVDACDVLTDEAQRKQCFFEYLTQTIQEKLSVDTLAILYPEIDTIEVKVTVFPDSRLEFEPQFPKDSVAYDKIKIDSILQAKLVDLPKVNPAIKRGIPVKTQFVLPVILKTK